MPFLIRDMEVLGVRSESKTIRPRVAPQVSLQGLTSVLLDISDVVAELPPTNGGAHPVPSGTEWHLFLSRRTGDYPAWDSKATTCRIVSHRTTTGLEWPPIPVRLRRTSGVR